MTTETNEEREKRRIRQREYYNENKDYINKYRREYYKKNKQKIREYHRNYYKLHKEKLRKSSYKYRQNLKDTGSWDYEKQRQYNKQYYKSKRGRINILKSRWKTRSFSRFISFSNYLKIMMIDDESTKRSIMTRLGKGLIDERDALREIEPFKFSTIELKM